MSDKGNCPKCGLNAWNSKGSATVCRGCGEDDTNKPASFPSKKYHLILADPPWPYKNKKTGGSMCSGAGQKYPTMSIDELCKLPIKSIMAKDCVLAMWVTTPLNIEAYQVWNAWGFKYKTKIYWEKMKYGLGYWFRGEVEELWIGIKGHISAFGDQHPNIIRERATEHSRKPAGVYTLLEAQSILEPWIELFARDRRAGWDAWGNQVPSTVQTTLAVRAMAND